MSAPTHLSLVTERPSPVSSVLNAAYGLLRRDWMIHSATFDMRGSLRSHRGHNIRVLAAGNKVHAVAFLDDGTTRAASATAADATPAALGKALADIITEELEGAHAAVSRTRLIAAKVACVAPDHARTQWFHGTAVTSWEVPGSYAEVEHRTRVTRDGYLNGTPDYTASHVNFRGLTVEQASTVLRAIRTDNRDPLCSQPVYGTLAEQMRAAAPGLYPIYTYNRHGHGLTTVSLAVDGVVDVDLHLLRGDSPVNLTVWGSMDNQLRAIAAL
ncbi:hypothetical protein [Streptomyces chrestomyceticus]|uniref:hypothetical protein n=1 Tax=Streptomyces chrestomyceticus TaxID=68185 RepID=UPI0033FDA71D